MTAAPPAPVPAIAAALAQQIAAAAAADPVVQAMRQERLAELLIEVAAISAGGGRTADAALTGAIGALAADLAARVGVDSAVAAAAAAAAAAAVLPSMLDADTFAGAVDAAEQLLPSAPAGRLADPCATVRADATALRTVYAQEWAGRGPQDAAPGGDELVCRLGQLFCAAALVADAARATAQETDPDLVDVQVTAARRYAWRWLRTPAPEAASPTHPGRTAAVLQWLSPTGAPC